MLRSLTLFKIILKNLKVPPFKITPHHIIKWTRTTQIFMLSHDSGKHKKLINIELITYQQVKTAGANVN
ncbi:protein of unknown function [Brevefilum fermentans]|uniref:Uncharacterized protein n=1 Tax=Candidatus Brevifilum fermentans TaxID=1986204 RepID=A0A1Y6K2I3_9CHLR|nr:protein of unknown function [Brevefilum fermentans]